MKLFDKLKNIFIEEELVDEGNIPIVGASSLDEVEKKVIEEAKQEIKVEKTDDISDRTLVDTKENFKFPIIFEDDDFKEEKKKSKTINVLERETVKYEPEIKKEVKVSKKSFKPSPVISPVYGVLDKNYSKEEIVSKDGLLSDYDTKVDIDSVIKKAYGETQKPKIEEEIKEPEINLFEDNDSKQETSIEEIDEKIKSIDDLLKDTTDDDFYSLVDSMYKEEEGADK